MDVGGIGAGASGMLGGTGGAGAAAPASGGGFGELLGQLVTRANESQQQSDQLVQALAKGEATDVHDVMLAMSEADVSFRLVLEVRNRLIEAYQEIQRMPL